MMFESVAPDPGPDALTRAARILYVLAVLVTISSVFFVITALIDRTSLKPVSLAINAIFIIAAWITGRGVEGQKPWAKWVALAIGVMELFNFPVGTVVGIAVIVYIQRANKAGLFRTAAVVVCVLMPLSLAAHPSWGIVVDHSGNVYYSDLETIWRIDAKGRVAKMRAGVSGRHVHELTIDDGGNVRGQDLSYDPATQTYTHAIWSMTPSGRISYLVAPAKNEPRRVSLRGASDRAVAALARIDNMTGVAIAADSALIITDGDAVRRINVDGTVITIARDLGAASRDALSFGGLMGIALDGAGNIYVADFRDRRVLRISRDHLVSTIATSAAPWSPTGVAVGPKGEVYVLENGFRPPGTWLTPRVRKIR